jgi:hypothetical protein
LRIPEQEERLMRTGLSVALIVLFAATAQARQEEAPVLELGAGAGYARSLHGDLYFGGPAVSGTARVSLSGSVALEAQVGYWQHTDRDSFRTLSGEIVDTSETDGFTSVTVSVIGRAPRRVRFAPYGGGGVGFFHRYSRRDRGASLLLPPNTSTRHFVSLGGQVLGGVDVHTHERFSVFGEFRFELQSFEDVGSAGYRVLAGVRVPIG